jgi:parallel beta-helix repeat protein
MPSFRPAVETLEQRLQPAAGHTAVVQVQPGQSIQAAIDAARPGTRIEIAPGTYAEALTINKADLQLVGRTGSDGSGVVLTPPAGGQAKDGIDVNAGGKGVVLRNFTVSGFASNGVVLTGVRHFRLSQVTATNDGEYGLFPVHSADGVIESCTATGHTDTGIDVGQSTNVQVRSSTASGNVNGFEVENSSRVKVVGNQSFNNTAGVLVVLLPGLDVKKGSDNLVANNTVHDNNRANVATPGDIASFVPAGSGILVVGTARTTVRDNTVTGNALVGVGVVSTLLLAQLGGLPPSAITGIDPNPEHTLVQGNTVTGNGTVTAPPPLQAADLAWDGTGKGNVWKNNTFGTSVPAMLPSR